MALAEAEERGEVADSIAVRGALMRQVGDGTLTYVQAQAELKRIQTEAKRQGKLVRADFYKTRTP